MAGLWARGVDPSLLHVDRLVGFVAAEQDGVVAWDQLVALGLGRVAIEHRVRRGLLHALHPRVYRWGFLDGSPWTAARGAVIACGDRSCVSHHFAAALHEMRPHPRGLIDVTILGRRVRRRGIRAHTVETLARADVWLLRGIPVTAPARALLEIAPELEFRELADAVEQAQVKRLVSKRDIAATIERAPRRPGVRALRALLEEPAFTRSHAERLLVSLVRTAKLPPAAFNARVEGYEVDVLWRRQRVVLELDSYAFHATGAAFERDRRRTAALTRGRYVVLRTTWHELTRESHALVARVAEALALSVPGANAAALSGGASRGSPARADP